MSNDMILNLIDKAHNEIMINDVEAQAIDIEISSHYKIIESLANKKEILQRKREMLQKDLDSALKLWQDENKNK